jgi:hypothetical protein
MERRNLPSSLPPQQPDLSPRQVGNEPCSQRATNLSVCVCVCVCVCVVLEFEHAKQAFCYLSHAPPPVLFFPRDGLCLASKSQSSFLSIPSGWDRRWAPSHWPSPNLSFPGHWAACPATIFVWLQRESFPFRSLSFFLQQPQTQASDFLPCTCLPIFMTPQSAFRDSFLQRDIWESDTWSPQGASPMPIL